MAASLHRLYEPEAYGPEADRNNYWRTTVAEAAVAPELHEAATCDVAIIGAGFTGLSAALHLAQAGLDVVALDAEAPAWGASGRNGGFACLGGAQASDKQIQRQYGANGLNEFKHAQRAAIDLVAELLESHRIDVDRHSDGEVIVAHRLRDVADLMSEGAHLAAIYGVSPKLIAKADMSDHGLVGEGFHGALYVPIGFALNPRKYALGLAEAAKRAGARIFRQSPVVQISADAVGYRLKTPFSEVRTRRLIVATNGYSSDNLPDWLGGRFLPVQSNIIVTRELTEAEISEGWHSDLMAYDTRNMLHYFRLLPERRFLFGMRGGIRADAAAQAEMQRAVRADFEAMFPMWAHVETPHFWSGLACLSRNLTPYAGPLGDMENAYTAMAYHGNGVAMASCSGKLLAGLITGHGPAVPSVMQGPMRRFPLPRWRRALLRPAYEWYRLKDR
ncbi:MAG: FAD-dependent oxidoreductase [Paracoccaceae bacterium]